MTRRARSPNLQVNTTWTDDVAGVKGEQPDSLVAQQPASSRESSDQIAGEIASKPKFKPQVEGNFEKLPDPPLITDERKIAQQSENDAVRWEYMSKAYRVGAYALSVTATVTVRWNYSQLPEPQIWIIGFVQNVLGVSLHYKFEGSEERTINRRVVHLDQLREVGFEGSNEPWVSKKPHSERGHTVFDYFDTTKRKWTIKLDMSDRPSLIYKNYRNPNEESHQLERAWSRKDFGLWILARPVDAPAVEIGSYVIVDAKQWSVTDGVEVVSGPGKGATIIQPTFRVIRGTGINKPSFSSMERGGVPKLTGPVAQGGYSLPPEIIAY